MRLGGRNGELRGKGGLGGVGSPQEAKLVAEDGYVGEVVGEGDVCY